MERAKNNVGTDTEHAALMNTYGYTLIPPTCGKNCPDWEKTVSLRDLPRMTESEEVFCDQHPNGGIQNKTGLAKSK